MQRTPIKAGLFHTNNGYHCIVFAADQCKTSGGTWTTLYTAPVSGPPGGSGIEWYASHGVSSGGDTDLGEGLLLGWVGCVQGERM